MTSLSDRVREGLGDRYHIVRELGRGGMAIVYLAYDVRHDRHVAIKVLQPELAHVIGTERFLREIRVAANLTHPNILPLHDSGEVDGLLYYIMPHIEGESLKERLSREKTLPVEDAVRITRQLAKALHYAHAQGVVHRDIKPANVLIAGDQVVLADFGIAHAVDTAPTDKLTSTGMAIGTPAYMSPEQVTGEQTVDGRSDLYGLACMLYEMLTGAPPFSAPTSQGLMARQAVDRAPKIAKEHGVPRSVELAIAKAMAKSPDDRFQDGADFAAALDTAPTLTATLSGLARSRPGRRIALAFGLAVAIAGSAFLGSRLIGGSSAATEVDARAVAVMPFRVGGAVKPGDRDLLTGLPQLLYERLPGEGGPRAVFPETVVSAMRQAGLSETGPVSPEEAARLAIDVGAGQVLLGTAVGAAGRITLTATLLDASDGSELARAEEVTGPPDSLLALVDELAAKLLSRQAGVAEHTLPSLLSTELPALRAYLAGQAEHAAGRDEAAAALFNEALDHDSTFALAGLSLIQIRDHAPGSTWARAIDAAWNHRDRLSERDQLVLEAVLGPRWPEQSTERELLDAWERVVYATPDRAMAWAELGERRFRVGGLVGLDDPWGQAVRAYERALELDPEHLEALESRLEIAILTGDTAAVREYDPRFQALQPDPDVRAYHRWRLAVATGDTATLREIRGRFAELPEEVLGRILFRAQLDGVGLEDAERAARIIAESAAQSGEQSQAASGLRRLLLNRGRPAEAATVPWRARSATRAAWTRLHRVLFVLYWGADATEVAPPDLEAIGAASGRAPDQEPLDHFEVCASGLLLVADGDHEAVARAVGRLQAIPRSLDTFGIDLVEVCAAILDAERAVSLAAPDARAKVEYLDSLMATGVETYAAVTAAGNLTTARLLEALGEGDRALAAIRRRRNSSRGVPLLSIVLREEGRLAEAAGDVEGAIAAYRHYLALRYDPEPAVAEEVAAIEERLAELLESSPRPGVGGAGATGTSRYAGGGGAKMGNGTWVVPVER